MTYMSGGHLMQTVMFSLISSYNALNLILILINIDRGALGKVYVQSILCFIFYFFTSWQKYFAYLSN